MFLYEKFGSFLQSLDSYRLQVTLSKGPCLNLGHTVRNHDGFQTRAIFKCRIINLCYPIRNYSSSIYYYASHKLLDYS